MLVEELAAAIAMSIVYMTLAGLLLIEAVGTVVGFVLEVVVSFLLRDRTAGSAARSQAGAVSAAAGAGRARLLALLRNRWVRRAGIASAVCLGVTLLAVLALNFVFFDWTARKLLDGAGGRSGITVGFAEADGNLFTGRIRLTGVTLVRRGDPLTDFNAQAKEIEIDLDVWSMIWGDRRVELARAVGLMGTIERRAKGKPAPWYAKRNVDIDRLVIEGANVTWLDHTRLRDGAPLAVNLALAEFTGERLRTRWIAHDLLFRANGTGRLDGKPFAVSNEPTPGGGGRSVWRFEEIPTELLGDYVGGPMAWLTQGHAGVVATTVHGDASRGLEMDWRIEFTGVRAESPAQLDGWRRRLADAFVKHVNEHGDHLELAFAFQMDASGFDGGASADAAGLWDAVADAVVKEVARAVDVEPEQIESIKDMAAEKLRSLRRKRDDDRRDDDDAGVE